MITDEMKCKALDAYMRNDVSVSEDNLYAALEAIAPDIRNAALEEAAVDLDGWCDIYGDNAAASVRALKTKVTP